MRSEELAYASATELLRLIAGKQVSPVELTELFLSRIERLDSRLNSFLLLTRDAAMEQARAAEAAVLRGDELGALHGLPIAIKDTQMTAGIRTTMGSVWFADRVPERDAAVVERVRARGAVILGKTNASELGIVGTCQNLLGPDGGNPWNPDHTPGGSSAGAAAALAAYLCPLATGSDGGGSIRIPSHFCGIYGIKPTQGRVSAYTGAESEPMPNIFSQNGPLARTVRDAALLLQVLAGNDRRDPISLREEPADYVAAADRDIAGLRIAWSPDFGFADVHPDVADVTYRAACAFEELGCHVEEPKLALDPPYDTYGALMTADSFNRYRKLYESDGDRLLGYSRFFIEHGSKVTTADYARCLGLIDRLRADFANLFEGYDLLLSPTARFPAFRNGPYPGEVSGTSEFPDQYFNGAFTMPINASGHPAASIPAGFSADGLPIGLQIVGRKGDEASVIAASGAFELARPWIHHRPPVS